MISDDLARLEALNPNHSFIIQAPAGSGKTELLSQRFLTLLSHVEQPEEILAITFTRKAAKEMHQRIYTTLKSAALKSCPQEPHKQTSWSLAKKALRHDNHRWDLLHNPQRLKITTIDAFCNRLTQQMPVLSKLTQNPSIADDATQLYTLAIERLIQDSNPNSNWHQAFKSILLFVDNNLDTFSVLLQNMLAKREQWMPLILNSNQNSLRVTLENNFARIIEKQLTDITDTLDSTWIENLEQLINFSASNLRSISEHDRVHLQPTIDSLPNWQALLNFTFTNDLTLRKRVDKRLGFPPDSEAKNTDQKNHFKHVKAQHKSWIVYLEEHSIIADKLAFIHKLTSYRYSNTQWQLLQHISTLLPVACQYLQLIFAAKNQVDFTEISLSAISALGNALNPTNLALYLDHTLKHILIDEFQDTSTTQYHLLRSLTQEWLPKDNHTLFLVGDPMQSIYRFRQAEVQHFLSIQAHGIGEIRPTPLTLSSNYRSTPTIIDWVNRTFQNVFPVSHNHHLGAVNYSVSQAMLPNTDDSSIYLDCFESDQAEAEFITTKIRNLCDNHSPSIAILVRNRSHLRYITESLSNAKISYTSNEIESLASQNIIRDLTALIYSLLSPADHHAWVALLHSPLIGMTLDEVHQMFSSEKNETTIPERLIERVDTLSSHLKEFVRLYAHHQLQPQTTPLKHFLKQTWKILNGPEIYLQEIGFYEDFLKVLDKHTSGHRLDRENFELEISTLKASASNESNIHLMTLHKSKGLEFDVVFLPGLNRGTRPDDKALLLYDTFLDEEDEERLLLSPLSSTSEQSDLNHFLLRIQKQRLKYEEQRLLYVACTRAKKHLYLTATSNSKPFKVKDNTLLNHLWGVTQSQWRHHAGTQLDDQETNPVEISLLQPYVYSPLHPADIKYELHTTDEIDKDNLPEPYFSSRYYDQQIGTALHSILEHYTHDISEQPINHHIEQALKYLKTQGFKEKSLRYTQKLIQKMITHLQTDLSAQWLFSTKEKDYREFKITSINSVQKLQHHVVDRVFLEKNTLWIIDYKTAQPQKNESLNEFIKREENEYYSQLKHYEGLIRKRFQSPTRKALYFPLIPYFHELKN